MASDVASLALGHIPGLVFHRLAAPLRYGAALLEGAALANAPAIAVQVRDRAGWVRSIGGRFGRPSSSADGGLFAPYLPVCVVTVAVDYAHGGFAFRTERRALLARCGGEAGLAGLSRSFFEHLGRVGAAAHYWAGAAVYRIDDSTPKHPLEHQAADATIGPGSAERPNSPPADGTRPARGARPQQL